MTKIHRPEEGSHSNGWGALLLRACASTPTDSARRPLAWQFVSWRGFLWALVLLSLTPLQGAVASEKEMGALLLEMEKDVKRFAALRDEVAAKTANGFSGDRSTGVLQITLPKVVAGNELQINLLRKGGAWTLGWAKASAFGPLTHHVRIGKVTWEENRLEAEVSVELIPWKSRSVGRGPWGGPAPLFMPQMGEAGEQVWRDGLGVPLEGSFKGTLPRQEGAGTFSLRPSTGPFLPGLHRGTARWIPTEKPTFRPFGEPDAQLNLHQAAAGYADQARQVYEQIRALELQQRLGLPFDVAIGQITRCPLTRKDPSEKKKGKQDHFTGKRSAVAPKLDDVDDSLFENASRSDRKATGEENAQAQAHAGMSKMREHMAALEGLVRRWQEAGAGQAMVRRGDSDAGDPDFGPWDPAVALPKLASGVNRLPEDAGAAGLQHWPYLGEWLALGPFPMLDLPETQHRDLPDILPAFDSLLVPEKEKFPWGFSHQYAYWGEGINPWTTVEADPRSGFVTAPRYSKFSHPIFGVFFGGFFATTELEAPRAGEFWASLTFPVRAALWVNGNLVWTGDAGRDLTCSSQTHRFRLPLGKGSNRILVRTDALQNSLGFALRICVRGAPRAMEAVQGAAAAREAAYAKVGSPYAGVAGGDANASRVFAGADPVVAWDLDNNCNVVWRRELPHSSGGVVLAGDRVFTTQDPFGLVCLDKATGKLLWRRNMDPIELCAPEVFPQVKALVAEVDALDDAGSLDDQRKARRKDLLTQIAALHRPLGDKKKLLIEFKRDRGWGGPTISIPVTDGKYIWAKTANLWGMVLACFDLEGNRKWMKIFDHGCMSMFGSSVPSLALVGKRLIIQVPKYETSKLESTSDTDDEDVSADETCAFRSSFDGRRYALAGLDAVTGERQWESPAFVGHHWGNKFDADCIPSPLALRLTNGSETMDVLILSGAGAVIRADDGKVLMPYCGARASLAIPVSDERNSVWFTEHELTLVRFTMQDRDRIEARVVYRRELQRYGVGKHPAARCHLLAGRRLFRAVAPALLSFDSASGNLDFALPELWRNPGEREVYMPSIMAGQVLLCATTDRHMSKEPGNMSAILNGPAPLVLARNTMLGVTSAPVVEGDRVYVRSEPTLFCLGRNGAEGRRFEALVVARNLLYQIPPVPPAKDEAPVCPEHGVGPGGYLAFLPDQILASGRVLQKWLVAGPVPAAQAEEAARVLSFPKKPVFLGRLDVGQADLPAIGGHELAGPLALHDRASEKLALAYTEDDRHGVRFDLRGLHKNIPNSVCFWGAHYDADREMVWRLDLRQAPGVRFWIGGKEIKHGQLVKLDYGPYIFAMQSTVGELDGKEVPCRVLLWAATAPETEAAARRQALTTARPWLERVAKDVSDTDEGRQAHELLKEF